MSGCGRTGSARSVPRSMLDARGLTLPEMLIGLAMVGFLTVLGYGGLTQYREATATARAVSALQSDVMVARSLAVKSRAPISLIARESTLEYVIRDTAGNVFARRFFDGRSELALTTLDIQTAGDSLTFDSRGVLITAGPQIQVTRRNRTRTILFNAMGRSRVN